MRWLERVSTRLKQQWTRRPMSQAGWQRRAIVRPLGLLSALSLSGVLLWQSWPWTNLSSEVVFQFTALPETDRLSPQERDQALQIVLSALQANPFPQAPADAPPEVPERFVERDPRPVWVTLYRPDGSRGGTSGSRTSTGQGSSLEAAPARLEASQFQGMAEDTSLYRSLRLATQRALQKALLGAKVDAGVGTGVGAVASSTPGLAGAAGARAGVEAAQGLQGTGGAAARAGQGGDELQGNAGQEASSRGADRKAPLRPSPTPATADSGSDAGDSPAAGRPDLSRPPEPLVDDGSAPRLSVTDPTGPFGSERTSELIHGLSFVQVDVMQARAPLHFRTWANLLFQLEPGVDGLIGRRDGRVCYQLPSQVLTAGLLTGGHSDRWEDIRTLLSQVSRCTGLASNAWSHDETLALERFRTQSFGMALPDPTGVDLFRANRWPDYQPLTARALYESLQRGVEWLAQSLNPDGSFRYEYLPNQDQLRRGYSMVRHAGTVYGMLQIYQVLAEPQFLTVAQAANPYLLGQLRPPEVGSPLLGLADGDAFPTGGVALTLLAELSMPSSATDPAIQSVIEPLGRFLLQMIDANGRVFDGYRSSRQSDRVIKESPYFPGEALLALTHLSDREGGEVYLEAARRIADHQIYQFYLTRQADHWVIQGLSQLHRITGDERYQRACLTMAYSYLKTQYPPNQPPFMDYFGAFRIEGGMPRTSRVGVRLEALRAARDTALRTHQDPHPFEEAMTFGAGFLVRQQFKSENAFFLPVPGRALGGFRAGLTDNLLRIDQNQHAMVGLLGALEVRLAVDGVTLAELQRQVRE